MSAHAQLHTLMGAQIRKGCRRVAKMDGLMALDAGKLTFEPWFRKEDQCYRCWNESILGFYGMIACARAAFRGINFLTAGDMSLACELWAPANGLFYTAAYHALHAYLGTVGRVIFDSPVWTDSMGELIEDAEDSTLPPSVLAILRKNNTWGFEPRGRGHRWRWLELRQAFGTNNEDIPHFLHVVFEEMYGRRFRKGIDLKAVLHNPELHRITIGEVFEEFLGLIAHSRHAALYAGIGIDPSLSEAMINGDHIPRKGEAGGRARAMAALAQALLACAARFIVDRLRELDPNEELQRRMAFRIFDPWADSPRLSLLPEGELRTLMQEVEVLLESLQGKDCNGG